MEVRWDAVANSWWALARVRRGLRDGTLHLGQQVGACGPLCWGSIPRRLWGGVGPLRPGKAQPGGKLRVLFIVLLLLSPLRDLVISSLENKIKYIYINGGFLVFCLSSFIRKVEIKVKVICDQK